MENKVGEIVPAEAQIAQLTAAIHEVAARVRRFAVTLTADQRAHTIKYPIPAAMP
jgi:hypothetical protein